MRGLGLRASRGWSFCFLNSFLRLLKVSGFVVGVMSCYLLSLALVYVVAFVCVCCSFIDGSGLVVTIEMCLVLLCMACRGCLS